MSDDDNDLVDDDNDDSISDESSFNESVGSKSKKKQSNSKQSFSSNIGMKSKNGKGYGSNSLLQINSGSSYGGHSSKPARIRTVLNEKQLQTLRSCYGANPRPDALMKEQLVELTGLNPRVIRVWFQNKRCKDKKKNMLNRPDNPMQLPNQFSHLNHPQNHPLNTHNSPIPHHVMYEHCF